MWAVLFLNPLLTSVIKRVQNVSCQAYELTMSNTHGYYDVRTWIFFTKNIAILLCNWGAGCEKSIFPREHSITEHKLVLPLNLNSAVPNPYSQFKEQLAALVTRKSFVSEVPNQIRGTCDGWYYTFYSFRKVNWVVVSAGTPEFSNSCEDQSCSIIWHIGMMKHFHRTQKWCLNRG